MEKECWDKIPYFLQVFAFQLLPVLVKSFFKKILILDCWVDLFSFGAVTDTDEILRFLLGVFFLGEVMRGA